MQTLDLVYNSDWRSWAKSDLRPKDIPANPDNIYKDTGWTNWPDFLGRDVSQKVQRRNWRSFEDARKFAKSLKLGSNSQWRSFSKSNMKPKDIPASPDTVYADSGWTNWYDFLGITK